ncbi:TIGR00730 family Rossman fold protein [Ideonella sp. BN130291]|uniref:LOG family protein n=1 Tax=Ideonella sp. BN130291 TaxID=3112940 RepID=UPI002E264273|nr:TIGR00730 family Rossman fold protein [Ideonella sp. BN130291]
MRDISAPRLSVCVYCGSRPGADPVYAEHARTVGRLIGERGWRLVYGGGKVGLMGEVADATLAAGGQVLGVIPDSLMRREVGHHGLTELHVVSTMHQRKQMMAEHADMFLALPGGIGTFEELFEVWTWRQLGYHDKPVGLLNSGGYYDAFMRFIGQSVEQGFLSAEQQAVLQVGEEPVALLDRLATLARSAAEPDDYTLV